jgi:hypothetical protein
MPKFMFIFRGGGYASPAAVSPSELAAHLARWTAWSEGLMAAGKLAHAQPLEHPPTGRTVRAGLVTDGPYAEAKELVSGIVVVEAASLDEAAELARGCPILEYDGTVEVRPALDRPPARAAQEPR